MRLKGLIQLGAPFAGQSPGECPALAAVPDIMPNSSLVDHHVLLRSDYAARVERDEQGRSNYVMCAYIR